MVSAVDDSSAAGSHGSVSSLTGAAVTVGSVVLFSFLSPCPISRSNKFCFVCFFFKFVYFWLCWVCCSTGFSLLTGSRGCSSIGMRGPLVAVASVAVEHRQLGTQAAVVAA